MGFMLISRAAQASRNSAKRCSTDRCLLLHVVRKMSQQKLQGRTKIFSIIVCEELTPKSLGALLAHFENKIMFQGFVWNLNSFDQEGVQLGKVLAKRVLAHDTDGALKVYSDLLDI